MPFPLGCKVAAHTGTWGVLDRLLDDERIIFDAISGTSAGAINAVGMADWPFLSHLHELGVAAADQ